MLPCDKSVLHLLFQIKIGNEVMGAFCGEIGYRPVATNSNIVTIRFRSNSNTQRKGFKISWEAGTDIF